MGGRGPAGPQVNVLRILELLQTHITPALCHAVFGRVRRTERQRVWTLDALVRFWTAVILRAPTALSQALADAREDREPLFPRIKPTPEAFFSSHPARGRPSARAVPVPLERRTDVLRSQDGAEPQPSLRGEPQRGRDAGLRGRARLQRYAGGAE
jgi:hypothetical protein